MTLPSPRLQSFSFSSSSCLTRRNQKWLLPCHVWQRTTNESVTAKSNQKLNLTALWDLLVPDTDTPWPVPPKISCTVPSLSLEHLRTDRRFPVTGRKVACGACFDFLVLVFPDRTGPSL